MKRSRLLLTLATLGLMTIVVGVRTLNARTSPAPAPTTQAAGAVPLELASTDLFTAQRREVTESVPITGTLKAVEQAQVRTKVAGILTELNVREGTSVRRGQPIARLDPNESMTRLQERTASLQSAQAQLDQSQRVLANTQRLFEKRFIAQSALDQADANVAIAQGQRDAAAAQRDLARTALRDTLIVAPIDGVVAERFVQAGERVSADSRVLTVVNLTELELESLVPAGVAARVQPGAPVTLHIEGMTQPHSGRVARIGPSTQTGTRSVPLFITVRNTTPVIRAGLFARGRLTLNHRDDALVVPATAIHDQAGQSMVYVLQGQQLSMRPVVLGIRDERPDMEAQVEIQSGLSAGDTVVSKPLGTLPLDRPLVINPAPGP
jgi:membrane fusion protein (multidrug efflux system)